MRTLYWEYVTNKRKSLIDYEQIDNLHLYSHEEICLDNIDIILDEYNLTISEREQCKLLNMGYTIKEIAARFKLSTITIYKRNLNIRQKILKSNINLA